MNYKAVKPLNDQLMHINGKYPVCMASNEQWTLDRIRFIDNPFDAIELQFHKDKDVGVVTYPLHAVEYLGTYYDEMDEAFNLVPDDVTS